MATFDIETEEITAFNTGNIYIFKTYFDENQLFKQLQTCYNEDKYRFKIPDNDLKQVRQLLEEYYYELAVADDMEDYCVVVNKKADSSDNLRNPVMRKRRGQHEILVMKNLLSKNHAIEKDAVSLENPVSRRRNQNGDLGDRSGGIRQNTCTYKYLQVASAWRH